MLSLQNNNKKKTFLPKDTHMIHLLLTLIYEFIPTLVKPKSFWTLCGNI